MTTNTYIRLWFSVSVNFGVYSFIGLLAADVTFLQIPLRSSLLSDVIWCVWVLAVALVFDSPQNIIVAVVGFL